MSRAKPLAVALVLAGLAIPALAETFGDTARVVSVRPITERIPVSREECWNDRVRGYEERRITRSDTGAPIGAGTVLGAVVGGVIGHQMGDSHRSRDRGAVAGAVVGGLIGHQAERTTTEVERVPVERNVERCRVVDEVREARVGFDVTFEYNRQRFTTRMPYDPGDRIRVRVDVQPVEEPPPPPREGPRPPRY